MHPTSSGTTSRSRLATGVLKALEGTLDYLATFQDLSGQRTRIADAKYGAGQYVAAANNEQLLYYALPTRTPARSAYSRCRSPAARRRTVAALVGLAEELLAPSPNACSGRWRKRATWSLAACKWCPFLPTATTSPTKRCNWQPRTVKPTRTSTVGHGSSRWPPDQGHARRRQCQGLAGDPGRQTGAGWKVVQATWRPSLADQGSAELGRAAAAQAAAEGLRRKEDPVAAPAREDRLLRHHLPLGRAASQRPDLSARPTPRSIITTADDFGLYDPRRR